MLAQDVAGLTQSDVVRRVDGRVVAATTEERRYSTPELLALENQVLDAAADGRNSGRGQVQRETATAVLDARPQLSGEQREMVSRLLSDGDQIAVVVGKAGTGKTYALDAAREGWQADGYQVIGAALARRAALELRDGAGIDSTSIHALVADLRERPGELIGPNTVLVVDEAGMVSTRQLAELVDHVQAAKAKLVLVGDPRQLPEIDAGGTFRSLTIRDAPIRLGENRRQPEQWEQETLEQLRTGRAGEALAAYQQHGRLVLADTAGEQRERMVEDWWTARGEGREAIMVALRRADVAELNQRTRARMVARGQLGEQALTVHGQPVAVGDLVVALHNHTGLGVTNGTTGTVTAVDTDHGSLTIRERGGQEIELPADYLQGTTRAGGPTLDYAYALTGHKAQGITVDDALVLGSDALYREWGYVAMSRGRNANRLYLVSGEPELEDPLRRPDSLRPVERVTHALAVSRAQTSATDTVLEARIQRMTTPQLEAELTRLKRQHDAQHRVARREQALAEREARLGREAQPAAETSAPDLSRGLIAAELQRRQRPAHMALLLDPPAYLIRALGPVPERITERRRWLELASDVESIRERLRFTDRRQALPNRVDDEELRADIRALEQRIRQGRAPTPRS